MGHTRALRTVPRLSILRSDTRHWPNERTCEQPIAYYGFTDLASATQLSPAGSDKSPVPGVTKRALATPP